MGFGAPHRPDQKLLHTLTGLPLAKEKICPEYPQGLAVPAIPGSSHITNFVTNFIDGNHYAQQNT